MSSDIFGLVEKVRSYLPNVSSEILERAYAFAKTHHEGQKRASGEPYVTHPLAVAHMLADLKLDCPSVIAGLLHDTVEDTAVTLDDIKDNFGTEIAYLVDGVTKLSRMELQSKNKIQAENLRKFVLAMAQDIRVLLIKLMDRLHNMRTLKHLPSEGSRKRIALETLEIYSPLAERIGMHLVQEDLQNLSFRELNREAYDAIRARIEDSHLKGQDVVDQVIKDLQGILEKGGLKATVFGREKKPYSVWRKMQRKNINFEQLSDLFGFRVLLDSVADCYQALGLIHNAYLVLPQKFKDYISTPKPNHYQSIHTTVMGTHGLRLEIQIRTHHMQAIAQRGVAGHWQYKQSIPSKDLTNYRWLRNLLEILEHSPASEEFLEQTKLEMFQNQVFCFTPQGDVISLPSGATVLDFAYALHSDIGNHCQGAKVNGIISPIKAELHNGDQVDIMTDKEVQPSADWERLVITGKAQANIRRFLRSKKRAQSIKLGRSILKSDLSEENRNRLEGQESVLAKAFGYQTFEDVLAGLGDHKFSAHDLLKALSKKDDEFEDWSVPHKKEENKKAPDVEGVDPKSPIHYAGCCHPLPGDKISGIHMGKRGVTIHRTGCEMLLQYEAEPKKWVEVSWAQQSGSLFTGRLVITIDNTVGTLSAIATIIAKGGANITNLRVLRRHRDFFELLVDVQVSHVTSLERVIALLRTLSSVQRVERG